MASQTFVIDRLYWAVLIMAPLGYGLLNFEAFTRVRRRYLLALFVLELTLFATTALMFLMRESDLIQGDLRRLRQVLLVITIARVPVHVYFYSRLLRDLPDAEPGEGD